MWFRYFLYMQYMTMVCCMCTIIEVRYITNGTRTWGASGGITHVLAGKAVFLSTKGMCQFSMVNIIYRII